VSSTVDDEKDVPTENLRYLVKWANHSHLHDTWDSYEYLKVCRFRIIQFGKRPRLTREVLAHSFSVASSAWRTISRRSGRL
jgi:hypothetical protein